MIEAAKISRTAGYAISEMVSTRSSDPIPELPIARRIAGVVWGPIIQVKKKSRTAEPFFVLLLYLLQFGCSWMLETRRYCS